jgi:heme-degrading monooxygenase HmoA
MAAAPSAAGRAGLVGPAYVSVSRLRVDALRSDELVAAFGDRVGLVDAHDGFLDLQIWRSDRDPTEVLMVSRWRDRAAFSAYMKSADHRVSHARMSPGLKSAIKLERLEHLQTYEIVAE